MALFLQKILVAEDFYFAWYVHFYSAFLKAGKLKRFLGVKALDFGIKKMKTRWGTCNYKAKRVWLNLELTKKPVEFTEYVVVHELLHLIEKNHSERFVKLLTQHLPKWRSLKEELNRFVLTHEEWSNR